MVQPGPGSQWPPPGPQWTPPPPQWPVPPSQPGPAAGARTYQWYVVYVLGMAFLYLLCALGGAFLLLADLGATPEEATELKIQGGVLLAFGVIMFFPFAAAPFLPRRRWSWIYGLVLIGLGATSCCTWPITVPLLIQWLKPGIKARFGAG